MYSCTYLVVYIYSSMLNSVEHGCYIYFVGFMLPHCTAAALGEMVALTVVEHVETGDQLYLPVYVCTYVCSYVHMYVCM